MVKSKKSRLSGLDNPEVLRIIGEIALERLQKLEEEEREGISNNRTSTVVINENREESTNQKRKKPKVVVVHQVDARSDAREESTPEWLLNYMRKVKGSDPKKIIDKKLLKSDLCKKLYRLSIPVKQVVDKDFLSKGELSMIQKQGKKKGIKAVLVDEEMKKWDVELRRWGMNSTSTYVLVNGWTQVLQDKGFVVDDQIRLWSFRSHDGLLHFALLPLPTGEEGQSGSPPGDAGQASSSSGDAGQASSSSGDAGQASSSSGDAGQASSSTNDSE